MTCDRLMTSGRLIIDILSRGVVASLGLLSCLQALFLHFFCTFNHLTVDIASLSAASFFLCLHFSLFFVMLLQCRSVV